MTLYRRFAELRQGLHPLLVEWAASTAATGVPMMRPLWFDDPDDAAAWEAPFEYRKRLREIALLEGQLPHPKGGDNEAEGMRRRFGFLGGAPATWSTRCGWIHTPPFAIAE